MKKGEVVVRRLFWILICAFLAVGVLACAEEDNEEPSGMADDANNGGSGNKGEESNNGMQDETPCTQGPTCPGNPAPMWSLEDIQPQSDRFGESYGLEAFEGKVVFVAMLAAWCPYCQAQAEVMESMLQELREEGLEVEFAIVNALSAVDTQQNLIDRCSIPIFQDTEADGVWDLHQASKDDFFVYRADGTLHGFYNRLSHDVVDLRKAEGYSLIADAIREAASE